MRKGKDLGGEPSADAKQALVHGLRKRADSLRVRANAFLFAIIGVVLLGVGLILALPPLIAEVDRAFSDVSPPEVAEQLESSIDDRIARLGEIEQQRVALATHLNETLGAPLSTWERIELVELVGELYGIVQIRDGGFLAAGRG